MENLNLVNELLDTTWQGLKEPLSGVTNDFVSHLSNKAQAAVFDGLTKVGQATWNKLRDAAGKNKAFKDLQKQLKKAANNNEKEAAIRNFLQASLERDSELKAYIEAIIYRRDYLLAMRSYCEQIPNLSGYNLGNQTVSGVFVQQPLALRREQKAEEDQEDSTEPTTQKQLPVSKVSKSLSELVKDEKGSLLITGEPGLGKSMHFRKTVIDLINDILSPQNSIDFVSAPLPLYIPAYLFKQYGDFTTTVEKAVLSTLDVLLNRPIPKKFFDPNKPYSVQKWLVFLDGLDEITPLQRQQDVAYAITNQHARHNTNLKFVLSCRSIQNLRHADWTSFKHYDLKPLDEKKVHELCTHLLSENQQINFFKEIKKKRLSHQIKNPLLLTVSSIVFREQGQLPEQLTELYHEFIIFLFNRSSSNNKLEYEAANHLLETIASNNDYKKVLNQALLYSVDKKLIENNITQAEKEKQLLSLLHKTGIVFAEDNNFRFIHESFKDYFHALKLSKKFKPDSDNIWRTIDPYKIGWNCLSFLLQIWDQQKHEIEDIMLLLSTRDLQALKITAQTAQFCSTLSHIFYECLAKRILKKIKTNNDWASEEEIKWLEYIANKSPYALSILEEISHDNNREYNSRALYACKALYNLGHIEEAIYFLEAIFKDAEDEQEQAEAAILLFDLGANKKEALDFLKDSVEEYHTDYHWFVDTALALIRFGERDLGIEKLCLVAEASTPSSAHAIQSLIELGEHQKALSTVNDIFSIDNEQDIKTHSLKILQEWDYIELADIFVRLNDIETAKVFLKKVIKIDNWKKISAAEKLIELGEAEYAIEYLTIWSQYSDNQYDKKSEALGILIKIPEKREWVLEETKKLIQNPYTNKGDLVGAIDLVVKYDTPENALELLTGIYNSKYEDIESHIVACEALIFMGQQEIAIPRLFNIVNNNCLNIWDRINAAEQLAQVGYIHDAVGTLVQISLEGFNYDTAAEIEIAQSLFKFHANENAEKILQGIIQNDKDEAEYRLKALYMLKDEGSDLAMHDFFIEPMLDIAHSDRTPLKLKFDAIDYLKDTAGVVDVPNAYWIIASNKNLSPEERAWTFSELPADVLDDCDAEGFFSDENWPLDYKIRFNIHLFGAEQNKGAELELLKYAKDKTLDSSLRLRAAKGLKNMPRWAYQFDKKFSSNKHEDALLSIVLDHEIDYETAREAAEIILDSKYQESALKAVHQLEERQPQSYAEKIKLVRLLFGIYERQKAETLLISLTEHSEATPYQQEVLADLWTLFDKQKREYDILTKILSKQNREYPDDLKFSTSKILSWSGYNDEAINAQKEIANDPTAEFYTRCQAIEELKGHINNDEILAIVYQMISALEEEVKENEHKYLDLARSYILQARFGNFEEAIDSLGNLIERASSVWIKCSLIDDLKELVDQTPYVQKLDAISPKSLSSDDTIYLAKAYGRVGLKRKAISLLTELYDDPNRDREEDFCIAGALFDLKQFSKAKEVALKALEEAKTPSLRTPVMQGEHFAKKLEIEIPYYQKISNFLVDENIKVNDKIELCQELIQLGYSSDAINFLKPVIEDEGADINDITFICFLVGHELGGQCKEKMKIVVKNLAKKEYQDWEEVYWIADAAYLLEMNDLAKTLFLKITDQMPKNHDNYDHFLMALRELGEASIVNRLKNISQ